MAKNAELGNEGMEKRQRLAVHDANILYPGQVADLLTIMAM